jgi:signal transduction histidine kinase
MARLRREAFLREQALRREIELHAQHLEKTVPRRTSKLRETVADLEQFSYAITHDMRAPLRAMQGFASMLEEETLGDHNPLAQEYSKRIRAASVRMDQLITDSLNYSKVVRQELTIEPVDLNELIAGLIETYPNLQPDQADIELQPDLPLVLGNEAALTQCFSNLLGNAVKFTQPGVKPKVRVRPESGLRSTEGDRNHFVRIWVEDEGIGIAKAFQERIFGMFQRAAQRYEGTGIGLAIVRKSVERLGGRVGVESEEGQGSRFWVDLPLAFTNRDLHLGSS